MPNIMQAMTSEKNVTSFVRRYWDWNLFFFTTLYAGD